MVHKLKQDKRSVRTRAWLLDTLVELLGEKEYVDISITELTARAGIARQTFYRNYNNMDDILLYKLKEIHDDYLNRVQKHMEKSKDSSWDFEVKQMIFMCQRNVKLFRALQKAGLAFQMLEKLSELFSHIHMKAQNLKQLNEKHQYLVYYLAGGVFMVLNKWFENEMKFPISALTDLFEKAASNIDQIGEEYIKRG